jgi:TonB family protein
LRRDLKRCFCRKLAAGLLAALVSLPVFASQQPAIDSTAVQTPPSDAKAIVDADGTYHVGNGVTAPKLVYSTDVEFSDAARRRKIQGTVVVALKVGTDGLPTDVRVKRSAAQDFTKPKDRKAAATLDEKAVEAARQYRFEPATYEGKPVPVAITIEVNFHIG